MSSTLRCPTEVSASGRPWLASYPEGVPADVEIPAVPVTRLLDDAAVESAMHEPPTDTRAYFRGRCLEKYADHVAAASWDSVIFDLPGRESLQRVPTIDPLRGTRASVGALIDRCASAEELFTALTS